MGLVSILFSAFVAVPPARAEERRRQDADPPELTQMASWSPTGNPLMDSMWGQRQPEKKRSVDELPPGMLPILKPGEEAQRRRHVKENEDATIYPQTNGAAVDDPEKEGRRRRSISDSVPDPTSVPARDVTPEAPTHCESLSEDCTPI